MTAGGLKYFTSAYVTIRAIRATHNCTLPIEVYYAGPEELPVDAVLHMQSAFDDVELIDITAIKGVTNGVSMQGFQIKIMAIIASSFREVLFLDADNIPLARICANWLPMLCSYAIIGGSERSV